MPIAERRLASKCLNKRTIVAVIIPEGKTMADNGVYAMVITTCANIKSAKLLAEIIVQERLAACVQLIPIESVYVWDGKVCNENETLMFIKTKAVLFDKLSSVIRENHPYDLPEIIRLPIDGGLPEYLNWIGETVQAP